MWLVRSWPTPSPGFRFKVAEVHDVYMVVSGESVWTKYTPAGLTSSIRIAVSAKKDFWDACKVHRQVKVDTLKCAR